VWVCDVVCGGVCGGGVVCSVGYNDLGAEGATTLASCLDGLTGLQTLKYVG
jgi:hypothetical protein